MSARPVPVDHQAGRTYSAYSSATRPSAPAAVRGYGHDVPSTSRSGPKDA